MPKKILITGGTGYLGNAVVQELANAGQNFAYTYRSNKGHNDNGIQLDLADTAAFQAQAAELADVDCLIHTAAVVSHGTEPGSAQDIQDQVIGSFEILKNLLEFLPNLRRIVYVSSCSAEIAEHDPSLYGYGKLFMEQAIAHISKAKGYSYACLRFPQLYGPAEPHNTFTTKFINAIQAGDEIKLVNNGAVVRDVLYVKEAAQSLVFAAGSDKQGVFTISDPETHTIRDTLDVIVDTIKPAQTNIQNTTVPEEEVAKASFHFESTAAQLGYSLHYTLASGLKETINHWRSES